MRPNATSRTRNTVHRDRLYEYGRTQHLVVSTFRNREREIERERWETVPKTGERTFPFALSPLSSRYAISRFVEIASACGPSRSPAADILHRLFACFLYR